MQGAKSTRKRTVHRVLWFKACLFFMTFFSVHVHACIVLDEIMCKEDQKNTGIATLNRQQRLALEAWLNEHVTLKAEDADKTSVYLSLNIGNGKVLQLSDGSYYQVAPDDVIYASSWIIPFEVVFTASKNADFPILLHNMTTGTSVKVKLLSQEELKELLNEMPPETVPTTPETAPLPQAQQPLKEEAPEEPAPPKVIPKPEPPTKPKDTKPYSP